MGKRLLQLGLMACLGALLAWLFTRGDEAPTPRPRVSTAVEPAGEPEPTVVAASEPERADRVEFRLPKMAPPLPGSATAERELSYEVPRDWQLRGSGSKNYELRSDRAIAFSGNYSAQLSAHSGEVQPNLSGSAVQSVLASPYVGTRVELTAALRAEGARGPAGSLWIYVTDPARVVIAYQIVQMAVDREPGEWGRYRIVMNVPWNGEVLAFGFTLQGKGTLWADDVRLTSVDTNVPITGPENNHQLGVIAQAVSLEGSLANPANLDFEDVRLMQGRLLPPPDEINATRF